MREAATGRPARGAVQADGVAGGNLKGPRGDTQEGPVRGESASCPPRAGGARGVRAAYAQPRSVLSDSAPRATLLGGSRLLSLLEQTPRAQLPVPCCSLRFPPSSLLIQLLSVPRFESLLVFQNNHLSTKYNGEARIQQKYTF